MLLTPEFDGRLTPQANDWVVCIFEGEIFVDDSSPVFSYHSIATFSFEFELIHHLGVMEGRACFVIVLSESFSAFPFERSSLRGLFHQIDEQVFALVARALQITYWLRDNQYCGRCGNPTQLTEGERSLTCCECGAVFFPSISPCVLGLVWRNNQILLAHNSAFKEGMYSILAGYIEPGENAEQALAREVKEEVNVEIHQPNYVNSQVWPFPSQLMFGYTAQYRSGDIIVDGTEILHADWFSVEALPMIPPSQTLSGKMIRTFINNRPPLEVPNVL